MKVRIVSPLPPTATGVADYAAKLSAELSKHVEVETTDEPSSAEENGSIPLYQIGNNALHAAAYEAALREPGVVVLHEAVLQHFLLGHLEEARYIEEFVYNYGEWYGEYARGLWRDRAVSGADARYFEWPMLRRLLENSRAAVVHNEDAKRRVLAACEELDAPPPVTVIPHFAEPPEPIDPDSLTALRRELGIPEETVVIGSFGYLRPTKRIGTLLRVVRKLKVPYRLLLAGGAVSDDYLDSLGDLLDDPRVIRVPFSEQERFNHLLALADVGVCLRHPSCGETSGVMIRLMALGKPVLVTAGPEADSMPELAAIPVDAGECEAEMLEEYLKELVSNRSMRETIGQNAGRYIAEHHSLPQVAEQYLNVLGGFD